MKWIFYIVLSWMVVLVLVALTSCGGGSRETPVYPDDQFAIPSSVVVPKE